MMFKAGNADNFINNITYRLTPGDLLLVCPNDIHGLSVKDHEPCERFPIHFNETFIQTFSTPNTNILTCFQNHEHNHILHLSEDQMREYEYLVTQTIEALNRKEFGYDIYAKANLSLILLLANQASVTKPVRLADITPQAVKDAIQYVDQNLSNTLSIQDIADHLNLSRSRFCHLFKDFTGTSPWNYIIARRIQHACTHSKYPLKIYSAKHTSKREMILFRNHFPFFDLICSAVPAVLLLLFFHSQFPNGSGM